MADSMTEALTLTQTPEAEVLPPPIILFLGPTSRRNTSLVQVLAQHHRLLLISLDDFAARNRELWNCLSSSALFDRSKDYMHDAWYHASPSDRHTAFILDALPTGKKKLKLLIGCFRSWLLMFAVSVHALVPSASGRRSHYDCP
jgi:hypothetical protein